jgi:hypothetical protein
MCGRGLLFIASFVLVWTMPGLRADPLEAVEAPRHVGEVATVCGFVASARYVSEAMGAPTFIDFGGAYPKAAFTALILGGDRPKFRAPETTLEGKQVCVTGEIRVYRGTPQMILTHPDQLNVKPSAHAAP